MAAGILRVYLTFEPSALVKCLIGGFGIAQTQSDSNGGILKIIFPVTGIRNFLLSNQKIEKQGIT